MGEGGPAGEGGVVDLGGVEGGEGNRVGWMLEGEEGSWSVGRESGKNTTGWRGETGEGGACLVGEEDWGAACLVGEEGEREAGLVGEDGEGRETGGEGAKRAGGQEDEIGSEDRQGAAESDVGDVSTSGGEETGKEVMGNVSAEGEGENWSELTGAHGGRSSLAVNGWLSFEEWEQGGLEADAASGPAAAAVSGASREAVSVGEASLSDFGTLAHDACLVGEAGSSGRADGIFSSANDGEIGTVWGPGQQRAVSWRVSLSRAVFMMTDTPAVALLCFGAVLKCVFSLPVTSIFMLFSMTASSES